jgi:hypothetical protein
MATNASNDCFQRRLHTPICFRRKPTMPLIALLNMPPNASTIKCARWTSRWAAVVEWIISCKIECCLSVSTILAALPDISFLLFETET